MPLFLALPGILTLFLAFNSGGVFEVTTAFAALVVLVAAAVALAVAPRPLAGLSRLGLLTGGLLALFALWTLLSARWSGADARALVSFDRALLYLSVLALFACVPRSEERFRWILRGLLAATAAVALVGLLSRLQPDLWPTTTGLVGDRLSYPLTYWNTFALIVGMACVLAVHHAADQSEPAALRIGAAALLPPLGAALLLTFSRGAIAVTVLGIVVYLLIARPRGTPGALLAVAAPVAVALVQTYDAELVHAGLPLTPGAISQADRLTLVLVLCAAGAAALRALTLGLDRRVARLPLESPRWREGVQIVATAVAGLAVIAFLAAGGPSAIREQYDRFVDNSHESASADAGQRGRLLEVGNDGRRPLWEVAGDTYRRDRWRGSGAGTFEIEWARHGSEGPARRYAYSLYLETLAELGIVGLVLLAGCLLAILVAIVLAARGPGRPAYAAAFALALAWVLHAGVDIDWQTPALGVPVFALAGLALARSQVQLKYHAARPRRSSSGLPAKAASWAWRPALTLVCLGLAVVPAGMALAQNQLREGVEALDADACARADDSARAAISTLDTGARPYEVLAMCAARRGEAGAAIAWGRAAVSHDPESWEPHYALALALASSGASPRAQIRRAVAANPQLRLLREAAVAFGAGAPGRWPASARALPFALE